MSQQVIARRMWGGVAVMAGTWIAGCSTPGLSADLAYFPRDAESARVVHLTSFNHLSEIAPQRIGLLDALFGARLGPFVQTPAGIAYRDGRLLICDTGLNVVHDWNLRTGAARSLGNSGAILANPVAVAVDDAGVAYVADSELGRVVVFAADGSQMGEILPPDDAPYRPVSVALHNDRLFVSDIAGHRVDVYSTSSRQRVDGQGGFYFPMGVTCSSGGVLFVSDTMNSQVRVFDENLDPLRILGQPGDRYGDLGKPKQLAVSRSGQVFIADPEFARVHIFDENGAFLMLFGGGAKGATPMPIGVTTADALPESLANLTPENFRADYFLFVTNALAAKRVSLFAVGEGPAQ